MRTASQRESPQADLNTQAKIRGAAIEHFAKVGFQKANLRAIAATAGVSAGSVIHHFGNKEGLRRACDEYVLRDLIHRARDEASPAGLQDVIRNYLESPAEFQIQIEYLARAISTTHLPAASLWTRWWMNPKQLSLSGFRTAACTRLPIREYWPC